MDGGFIIVKLMTATPRRPGMTHAEFVAYNVDVHGSRSRNHPVRCRRYLQTDVYDSAFGLTGVSEYDIVVGRDNATELYFDDLASLVATFTDPEVRSHQLMDGQNYVDLKTVIAIVATEAEVKVDHPGGGRL